MTGTCEFPLSNATSEEIKLILNTSKIIAIVGLSDKTERDSYKVAFYLKEHGYQIIPVNPNVKEVLSEKSYPSLAEIPMKVDIADIFRKPEEIPQIVDDAIRIRAKVIWMQLGLVHNASADKARANGLKVVMNKCIMQEHIKKI